MTEISQSTTSRADVNLPPWWLLLLEGLAALIIGIYLIISPARTTLFLVQVLGWYWLITGIYNETKTEFLRMAKSSLCVHCELRALGGENRKPQGLISLAHKFLDSVSCWLILIVISAKGSKAPAIQPSPPIITSIQIDGRYSLQRTMIFLFQVRDSLPRSRSL